MLVSGGLFQTFECWDVNGNFINSATENTQKGSSKCLIPFKDRFCLSGEDKIDVIDVLHEKGCPVVETFKISDGLAGISELEWFEKDKLVLSGGHQNILYNVESKKVERVFKTCYQSFGVKFLKKMPNSQTQFVSAYGDVVSLFDINREERIEKFDVKVEKADFFDENTLISCPMRCYIHDVRDKFKRVKEVKGIESLVRGMIVVPDKHGVVCSMDEKISFVDIRKPQEAMWTKTGYKLHAYNMFRIPNEDKFVSFHAHSYNRVWDFTGRFVAEFKSRKSLEVMCYLPKPDPKEREVDGMIVYETFSDAVLKNKKIVEDDCVKKLQNFEDGIKEYLTKELLFFPIEIEYILEHLFTTIMVSDQMNKFREIKKKYDKSICEVRKKKLKQSGQIEIYKQNGLRFFKYYVGGKSYDGVAHGDGTIYQYNYKDISKSFKLFEGKFQRGRRDYGKEYCGFAGCEVLEFCGEYLYHGINPSDDNISEKKEKFTWKESGQRRCGIMFGPMLFGDSDEEKNERTIGHFKLYFDQDSTYKVDFRGYKIKEEDCKITFKEVDEMIDTSYSNIKDCARYFMNKLMRRIGEKLEKLKKDVDEKQKRIWKLEYDSHDLKRADENYESEKRRNSRLRNELKEFEKDKVESLQKLEEKVFSLENEISKQKEEYEAQLEKEKGVSLKNMQRIKHERDNLKAQLEKEKGVSLKNMQRIKHERDNLKAQLEKDELKESVKQKEKNIEKDERGSNNFIKVVSIFSVIIVLIIAILYVFL